MAVAGEGFGLGKSEANPMIGERKRGRLAGDDGPSQDQQTMMECDR
jgi:hypothetical protein